VARSPDGSKVFITGSGISPWTGNDYATVGYDARTGSQLWAQSYTGAHGRKNDIPSAIGVSPDGTRVFVTGQSIGKGNESYAYATISYNAVTGKKLWIARFNGQPFGADRAISLSLSPDGSLYRLAHTWLPPAAAAALAGPTRKPTIAAVASVTAHVPSKNAERNFS
jgi:outer membrane protein assembly factor BamB